MYLAYNVVLYDLYMSVVAATAQERPTEAAPRPRSGTVAKRSFLQ